MQTEAHTTSHRSPVRRRTTRSEDLVTIVLGLWLIAGLFLDGYAHQHLITGEEGFFTPWHAVFYGGYAAVAVWTVELVRRRRGGTLLDRVPHGYGAAVAGVGLFGLGGIGDGLWHAAFGVETGIDALLSPTHLLLMVSLGAIVTAPYRAAAHDALREGRGVALVSLGIGTALAAFFLNFVWGLGDAGFRVPYDPATGGGEVQVIAGVGSVLVATALLTGATALALRLGRPAPGTFGLMFGGVALAVHLAFEEEAIGVAAAATGGLVLDGALRLLPSDRAALAPGIALTAMWAIYYGLAASIHDVAWPAAISAGTVVLAGVWAAVQGAVTAGRSTVSGE